MCTSREGAVALVRPRECTAELADFMAAMDLIQADYTRRFPA
ncbi:hypothetical protein OG735_15075 [Streptomyces sp. NBC_01210]|nr:hypothetical protein OG735_15075 [Streptomyces sp. NBC_01210]